MRYVASIDVIDAFRNAMAEHGIITNDPIIGDGVLHRIHVEGHKRGSRNGAYILHLDRHPAGWFMDFKSGITGTWRLDGSTFPLDDATRRAIEIERQRRQEQTDVRYRAAAERARLLWTKADPAPDCHPYLARKCVKSHGLRIATWYIRDPERPHGPCLAVENALLVPMVDEHGAIWSLQAIFPQKHPVLERDKDFLAGGKTAGAFFCIAGHTDTVYVAEGYATGATIHEATGGCTYVAFTAGNLTAVAMAARRRYPGRRLIVCADNDRFTEGNPGVTNARKAALAVGGLVSIPEFPEGETGTDWNDLALLRRKGEGRHG
ncbi:toprim domain-containing protein [Candidatus Methylocalor cossyra]